MDVQLHRGTEGSKRPTTSRQARPLLGTSGILQKFIKVIANTTTKLDYDYEK